MKLDSLPLTAAQATLQTVLDRLAQDRDRSDTRQRDLHSAVTCFARLQGQPPAAIPLNLADIRQILDRTAPAGAGISAKRFANLRSDLAAAIGASGLQPMLKTANVALDPTWAALLNSVDDKGITNGLSRLGPWASSRGIEPRDVDDGVLKRLIEELATSSLVRNFRQQFGIVSRAWNRLVVLRPDAGLRLVSRPDNRRPNARLPWETLPKPFRDDVERHLQWASVPDPLAEGARVRPLGLRSIELRLGHIHSAVNAAAAAGVRLDQFTSLAQLVEPETFRAVLGHLWQKGGRKLTPHTHGIAVTLVAIASEWVNPPAEEIALLKKLRGKLGTLPLGLSEKNKALLRRFDDPRLLTALVALPDRLWHKARRGLATSRQPFIELQTSLALDLLIHVPLRLRNLTSLNFSEHLHWPQGRRKPAVVVFRADEVKNDIPLEFEIPTVIADRLQVYRNEIAPAVIGSPPDAVFVTFTGKPRTQAAIKVAIQKTVFKYLGVKLTPHQFRHLAAKIVLDASPGAYELVRQLLAHRNLKTTTNNYAGIDTRRAGRAHADLIMKIREAKLGRAQHGPTSLRRGD
jgi:integrase